MTYHCGSASVIRIVGLLASVLVCLLAGACATQHESDLPWATPESWEGTVGLPGMSDVD
jgi:hypothetical protein